jgi:DNA polymerase
MTDPAIEMSKSDRYRELVEQRKRCACCTGMANASAIDGGSMDSERIGPFSRWQGNLDADLMVVAQDFADVEGFRKHRGWPGERVRTNATLAALMTWAGIPINRPRFGVADDRLFFTNAVLCMKRGGMRAPIPESCATECGRRFLRPIIELVSPRVLVSLGGPATGAVCRAFDLAPPGNLKAAIAVPVPLTPSIVLMPLYHPAASRSRHAQQADWERVREVLDCRTADAKPS